MIVIYPNKPCNADDPNKPSESNDPNYLCKLDWDIIMFL